MMEWNYTLDPTDGVDMVPGATLASLAGGYDCDEQHYYYTGTKWIVNGGPTLTNTADIYYYHNGGTCRGCQYISILQCWQACIESDFNPGSCTCDQITSDPTEAPSDQPTTQAPTTLTPTLNPITSTPTTSNPTSASPTTQSPTSFSPTTSEVIIYIIIRSFCARIKNICERRCTTLSLYMKYFYIANYFITNKCVTNYIRSNHH